VSTPIYGGPRGPQGPVSGSGTQGHVPLFAYPEILGDSIARQETDKIIVGGKLEAAERVTSRVAQGGGWRDLLGPFNPPNSGPTIPTLTQFGTTAFRKPRWALNDTGDFQYHLPHSYALGTPIHFHVHWARVGSAVQSVRWRIEYVAARGYALGAFPVGGSGTVVTITEAPAVASGTHQITESDPIVIADLEPDCYIWAVLTRITNGGTDNANDIFAWEMDIHHQSIEKTSLNRNGPWGT